MRRETKYAIAIGILTVAAGIWFFNSAPPVTAPSDMGLTITDATDAPAEDFSEPAPIAEVVLDPAPETLEPATAEETTHAVASPAPLAGPVDSEQSIRLPAIDLSRLDLKIATNGPQPAEKDMVIWQPGSASAEQPADVDGVEPTSPEAELAAITAELKKEPAEPKTHTIQSGDTFSKLAIQYFGHAKHARLISQANPDLDPRRLQVGMKINIPEAPASMAGKTPTTQPTIARASDIPQGRQYTVQIGETWYDLGQKFLGNGTRGVELYELNRERVPRNPDLLRAGTTIELPTGIAAAQ